MFEFNLKCNGIWSYHDSDSPASENEIIDDPFFQEKNGDLFGIYKSPVTPNPKLPLNYRLKHNLSEALVLLDKKVEKFITVVRLRRNVDTYLEEPVEYLLAKIEGVATPISIIFSDNGYLYFGFAYTTVEVENGIENFYLHSSSFDLSYDLTPPDLSEDHIKIFKAILGLLAESSDSNLASLNASIGSLDIDVGIDPLPEFSAKWYCRNENKS
ncbi:hypothetical protein [Aliiglaciecola lipolytica]|uniref:Uncharacterized protein n=1 Tax=Aliiglaciecola lipolytica E3 TaxID=1127673 RepID=K6WZK4_9ALTE|nr:hypothetical protein [Aliiglaciecola lipolytica]GAC13834.1 hypothetical protein GLIP_1193 [Aliiglaciecola lipolytica E3]